MGFADGDDITTGSGTTANVEMDAEVVKAGIKYVSGDLTFNLGIVDGEGTDNAFGSTGGSADSMNKASADALFIESADPPVLPNALSVPSPSTIPKLKVKSPDTYLIPAFTTSASISTLAVVPDPVVMSSPSANPTATVKSPVTALIPK